MYFGRAEQRMQRQLSDRLFQHVMSLPLRFHLDRKTGALNQTLTNGLIGYRLVLQHLTLTVLPVVVELGTMTAVLLLLDNAVFLAIIGASVLFYVIAFWDGVARIRRPARAASNAHIDANAVLTDSILNYETVKYFGAEPKIQGRFVKALAKTENHWSSLFRRKMENGLAVAGIFALSLGTSVCVAAYEVQRGNMSVGEFVLVNTYVIQLARPLEMIGFAFRGIAEGMAFVEKMTELINQKAETDLADGPGSFPASPPPDLIFERVSYAYRSDRLVLDDVNFVVPSGETVAIVGTSGSGKSSLVRLLMRLDEPAAGAILLNGVPLAKIPLTVLRDAIAVVPQDIALFNDTIAYNIGFGSKNGTKADIVSAAKIAHIHDFVIGLPDGYETKVGERGLKLSGGEKQRIAIARAVIKKPSIFVFDEATSSLDSNAERTILRDLIRIAKTTTTVIIAHRLSTVMHANEIVVMRHGRVAEHGTHRDLLRRDGQYAEMWYAQNDRLQSTAQVASFS